MLAALRRFSDMEVSNRIETEFGDKFEIRGRLVGPEGRAARVATVWMVETGETSCAVCDRLSGGLKDDT